MVSPAEALDMVLAAAAPLPARRVPLAEAVGRTLAETVRSDRPCPPFRRAMMDGYAVRLASAGREVAVVGMQAAGKLSGMDATDSGCVEVMAGAVCPPGTEAVVQKERVRREGDRVILPATIGSDDHIAAVGSECAAGEVVAGAGDVLTPLAVAALAGIGVSEVSILPPPRLAVIVTGEELASDDRAPAEGHIRDMNGPMLAALAVQYGLAMPFFRRVGDDCSAIRAALDAAADCELLAVSGGASAGTFDLVPETLLEWGAELIFRRVLQKPGKPLLLARRGRNLIFNLPGNPLACHFCFSRYVAAAAAAMEGRSLEFARGRLAADVKPDRARTRFVPAIVRSEDNTPAWSIHPLPGVSSADVFHVHQANAYAEVPPGNDLLPAGQTLPLQWLGTSTRSRRCRAEFSPPPISPAD